MVLQRCLTSASRGRFAVLRLFGGLILALALGGSPRHACAQQVFIEHMWVHDPAGPNCPTPGRTQKTCRPATRSGQFTCDDGPDNPGVNSPSYPLLVCQGNISNNPHIEFESKVDPVCQTSPAIPADSKPNDICQSGLFLCAKVGWSNKQSGNSSFGLDSLEFEVFKYAQGSNPLDPQSTPPLRTFFVDSPGFILAGTDSSNATDDATLPAACVFWDGSINIQGETGKSNGQYGFRSTVATNQTTQTSGNINISQTRAYPSGATLNGPCNAFASDYPNNLSNDIGSSNCSFVQQQPITVDVMDVHVVRTTPTVVGNLTGVEAEPYGITYRLSKDANVSLGIENANLLNPPIPTVRTVVPFLPRPGEGVPLGALQNVDSWDGRWDDGNLALPGVYLATITATAIDQYGTDVSNLVTRQISLDTLQITDLQVQPLTDQSTALAVLSYMLTEPANIYMDIYRPGTSFQPTLTLNAGVCNGPAKANPLDFINDACQDANPNVMGGGLKNFGATLNNAPTVPIRHIEEQKDARKSVITFWDGRDGNGNILPDGDYVFVLYASLPSIHGLPFRCVIDATNALPVPPGCNLSAPATFTDTRVWSSNAKTGFITITRGLVTVSQIGPSSTVIGSSPPVAGLDPFTFSYSLSRDANVTLKILRNDGVTPVRTLVNNEQRPGNFLNRERWTPPTDDNGLYVSSGNYLVQLTAMDPFFPAKVATTTALFPVNLFRITDVSFTPLLTGATDVVTINYQLSQPMRVVWNIYPPGTVISGNPATWPPCGMLEPTPGGCPQILTNGVPGAPLITIKGLRPGRLRITDFWDGRGPNGLFVPDGNYVFTLTAQSTATPTTPTSPNYFATDQVFGTLTVARGSVIFPVFSVTPTLPQLFNSSQTVSLPPYEIDYSLTRQSSVTVQILTTSVSPSVVRTLITGQVRDANVVNREFWDGRDDAGNFVHNGFYTVRAVAADLASVLASGSTAQQTISVDPLRIYDVAVSPLRSDFGNAVIAYQVSETMKASIKIYKPGTTFDGAGNPTPPEASSLVKRIVGVRPARTEVSENWNGTDLRLSLVPDGNYVFRIVASTDINSIDTVTGNVVPGAALADDIIVAEIPVTRGGALDPQADFVKNSFIYPNPLRGPTGTFQIYVPLQSDVSLRIYNIAGDLVLDQNFGSQSADSYVNYTWLKSNQAGRPVAHGVYFALIREEPNKGEKTPFQVVKKILIP